MTKVYGIYGRTAVELTIPVGKATLRLVFDRGCLDAQNFKPAVYTSTDEVEQTIIEHSGLFGKSIKLIKVYGEEAKERKVQKKDGESEIEGTKEEEPEVEEIKIEDSQEEEIDKKQESESNLSFPEIDNRTDAIQKLKELGAPATNLRKNSGINQFMRERGIEFPNYKFVEK